MDAFRFETLLLLLISDIGQRAGLSQGEFELLELCKQDFGLKMLSWLFCCFKQPGLLLLLCSWSESESLVFALHKDTRRF